MLTKEARKSDILIRGPDSTVHLEMETKEQGFFSVFFQWTRNQRLLIVAMACLHFCGFACVAVMGPFLPTEAEKKGIYPQVTGLIFSSYSFTVCLTGPVWGKLVHRMGVKVAFILGGLIAGTACIAFGVLDWVEDATTFVACSFAIRIVEAIGFAAVNTAGFAATAKVFPDTLSTVTAIQEIAIGAGSAMGPVIGSVMFGIGGFFAPFGFLGGLLLVSVVFIYYGIPSSLDAAKNFDDAIQTKDKKMSSLAIFKSCPAVIVCLSIIAYAIAVVFLYPTLSLRVKEIGIAPDKAGYMFLCHLGMYSIVAPASGRLSDKFKGKRFLLIGAGLIINCFGYLILGPSPIFGSTLRHSLASDVTGLLLIGFGSALALVPTFPTLLACAIDHGFSDDLRTYAMVGGLWSSVNSLGETVGPTFAAFLSEAYGFEVATTACAGILFVTGAITLIQHNWVNIVESGFCCASSRNQHVENEESSNSVKGEINDGFST